MVADMESGVTHNIAWPTKGQLAISLQKCRLKASWQVRTLRDENEKLRQRIAELEADAERLDAIEAYKHEYGCWEIQTDSTPIIWLSSSVRSSDPEQSKRTLRQVIDEFIAAQRQKAGER